LAKAREIPDLDPGDPYGAVANRVVKVRAAEIVDHADGVLDLTDIERLHAMRVSTRRLRAALEIFEPCFPEEDHTAALAEVKALADALGERRDRDVSIEMLVRFAEGLAAPDRRGIAGLIARIRGEQESVNDELAPMVAPERLDALSSRIAELTAPR
jgi:CHAD domain-containing protein